MGGITPRLSRTRLHRTDTHLEVSVCTPGEWERAIVEGFKVWREIKKLGAGTLVVNLDERSVTLKDK